MRFAAKVVPLGALGCAVALLVSCGNSNGLLSGSQADGLQAALSSAQSACAAGDAAQAVAAARSFSDRVNALPPGTVDRKLIANLQQGAATLQSLVPATCTGTTNMVTTTTTPTTVTATTTAPTTTATTPTTTVPTTPTAPQTTPTTTGPSNGGGSDNGGGGDTGGGGPPGNPGGATPGQVKKALKGFAKGGDG